MKRNPRKLKWTKAFRKAAGKEMTIVRHPPTQPSPHYTDLADPPPPTAQDSTLTFEKRRNVPIKYDRDLVQATITGMKRIEQIRARREKAFFKARMAAAAPATLTSDSLEVTRSSHLLSLQNPAPKTTKALSASAILLAARAEKKALRQARSAKGRMAFEGGEGLGLDDEMDSGEEDDEMNVADALREADMALGEEVEEAVKEKVKVKAKKPKSALKRAGGAGMGMQLDA